MVVKNKYGMENEFSEYLMLLVAIVDPHVTAYFGKYSKRQIISC